MQSANLYANSLQCWQGVTKFWTQYNDYKYVYKVAQICQQVMCGLFLKKSVLFAFKLNTFSCILYIFIF